MCCLVSPLAQRPCPSHAGDVQIIGCQASWPGHMSYQGMVIKASSAGYLVGLRHTNARNAVVLGPSARQS
jgi:hypothetical protein